MMSKVDNVLAFCEKFGIPINDRPGMIDPLLLLQRVGLVMEEAIELDGAAQLLTVKPTTEDLHDFLDASVDICYAVIATCVSFGFDFDEAWRRVHDANMKKERALNANNKRGSQYDIVKPQGWTSPDLTDLVTDYTLEDLLCEQNGLSLPENSPTQRSPISSAEIERFFAEFAGTFRASTTT